MLLLSVLMMLASAPSPSPAFSCPPNEAGEYKSLASIFVYEQIFCGGILVSTRWVLTAAQCINEENIRMHHVAIRIGPVKAYGQIKEAERGVRHHLFPANKNYDIGLVLMRGEAHPTLNIRLPRLPAVGFTEECDLGLAMAWKRNADIHHRSLKCGRFPLRNISCGLGDEDTVMCVKNKDACVGEKGGVLMCGDVVIGVLSSLSRCNGKKSLARFVRVENFVKFINDTMASARGDLGTDLNVSISYLFVLYVCLLTRIPTL